MKWIVTKEALVGVVRTAMAYIWVYLFSTFPGAQSWLESQGLYESLEGFVSGGFVLFVGTLLYAGIRWAAENPRLEWIGYLLVFNDKPSYNSTSSAGSG